MPSLSFLFSFQEAYVLSIEKIIIQVNVSVFMWCAAFRLYYSDNVPKQIRDKIMY